MACLLAAPALAQTAPATNAANGSVIETVVVTAEKRAQNVQDVPIAMSAISGDMLDKQGIKGFGDLSFHTPTLRFSPSTEGGENLITLRGIANVNVTAGGDSPVGYLVDGVYMGRSTSVDPEFFDVERIEVLRGPQGTLYGRNSVGGSVNIITNKPTDELAGHVDALIGDYNARTFRGWANVPLYDGGETQILARITGISAKHDAYQKNLSTAPTATHNSDAQDYNLLRAQLLFKFNADVDFTLRGSTSSNGAPPAFKFRQQWMPGDRYSLNGATPNPTDPRKVYKDYPETLDQTNKTLSGTLNWDLGAIRFTSITGYAESKWLQTADDDGSDLMMANQIYWGVKQNQISQEFHLASNDDANPLKWITGLFYFHERNREAFNYTDTGLGGTFPFAYVNGGDMKTTSYAAFGQLDYDLGKTSANIPLTFTAGARYTHDKKYGNTFNLLFASAESYSSNWAQWTGRLGLSYKVNDDVMLYATASQGYLSGGRLLDPGTEYAPETARSYEAGFKTQWFDDRLQLNGSAYHTKLKKQQVFVLTAFTTKIENAAASTINGVELEMVAIPVDGLRLNAEFSYMDATYDTYITRNNHFSPPPPADFSGNRLIQTPKYTLGLGAEYAIETSVGTITPRIDTFFSGNLFFVSDNSPQSEQKAYTRTNLNLRWDDPKRRYSIEGFVQNLENKDVISQDGVQAAGQSNNGLAYDALLYYAPRTVGVRFGVNF